MTWSDEHGARVFCPLTWTVRIVPLKAVQQPILSPAEEAALADLARDEDRE